MPMFSLNNFRTDRWVYRLLCIHLIAWTLAPILVRYNLPLDAIEGTIWGHQLEWGYDKNPFLSGWLTALAIYLDGYSGWTLYLFSQLCVVICLWATWQLAKNILPPIYALLSIFILESISYFNLHAIDFNDNTLELCLWSLTIYYFYKALRAPEDTKIISWVLTGLFAGLGVMAKYYTTVLLAGMTLFLFIHPATRKTLRTFPPYLGFIIFLIIILPHSIWLYFHDYITIEYVFDRIKSPPSWTNHFIYPAQFAWQQIEAILPAFILCAGLLIGKKPAIANPRFKLDAFNIAFLFYVGVMPFLITLLLSILFGIKLRAGWGMPLLSTWGIILIAMIQPSLTKTKVISFILFIFILIGALISGYSIRLMHAATFSSANFPGKEIAQRITQEWHTKYRTPLHFVGGQRWISGNIEFYSADHPAVFLEWNNHRSPWINLHEIQHKGAVFVWDMHQHPSLPDAVLKQFPQLQKSDVLVFNWHRSKNIAPIEIGFAMLPPAPVS